MGRIATWVMVGVSLFSSALYASDVEDLYFSFQEPQIRRVESIEAFRFTPYNSWQDCKTARPGTFNFPMADIGWDDIINIGVKVWKIVQEGQPVVKTEWVAASAMPSGISCWNQLAGWQTPKAQTYEVTYQNLLGMEVVKFSYRVVYSYGGNYLGHGQYLSQVVVEPANVAVLWLYNLEAKATVREVVNAGTAQQPLAGMRLHVEWTVKTPVKYQQISSTHFVRGDGFTVDLK